MGMLNKKTKLGRNITGIALVAIVFAFIISVISLIQFQDGIKTSVSSGAKANGQCDGLLVAEQCYALERADTNAKRIKGLSDRDSLANRTGMLFVFDQSMKQCIWMKDMRFNLDIVWLDEARTITRVEQNVSPATYPELFCAENTKYVIELNSGEAAKLSLNTGNQLNFMLQ